MPTRVHGKIREISPSLKSGLPRYEIWFNNNDGDSIPYEYGKRVALDLIIGQQMFTVGLRNTKKSPYIWICPDIVNSSGKKTPLSKTLMDAGYVKNQEIIVEFNGRQAKVIDSTSLSRIPNEITREHILKAIAEVETNGVAPGREATKWLLVYDGKYYPPKYVISIAGKYALGFEHSHENFSGGTEANSFLKSRGFTIVAKKSLPTDHPSNKVLLKTVGSSQHTDGVRINKEFHNIFNPPGSPFYVSRGTKRKVTVEFNNKIFNADYRYEGTQDVNAELQRIGFSKDLKNEFKSVFPAAKGHFNIRLGDNLNHFIFSYESVDETKFINSLEDEIQKSKKDTREERLRRLASASVRPESIQVISVAHKRNPDVIVETLFRANGKCERCSANAPFCRKINGSPYLEVHHIIPLSQGGFDVVDNAIAVCPNCHRELHYG